ncbi:MAG: cupredoxin domain-containing protein [Thermomicrobiales bacterium]|nr:cupredoxin domain-containing protein [Thermomicrobiales bacterium]
MTSSHHSDHDRADQLDRYLDQLFGSSPAAMPSDLDPSEEELFRLAALVHSAAPQQDAEALSRLRTRVLFPNGGVDNGEVVPIPALPAPVDLTERRIPRWIMMAAALLLTIAGIVAYMATSERGPFGSKDGVTTIVPAGLPTTDGAQLLISPTATAILAPTETPVVVPTVTAQGVFEPTYNYTIALKDIYYEPAALEVPANVPLQIQLVNEGAAPHSFAIDGVIDSVNVAPGEHVNVQITLEPGSYRAYCDIPGHREAGMELQLTAVEGLAAPSLFQEESDATIFLSDIFFDPGSIELPALVTSVVELVNIGDANHNLTIPDLGISVDVPPGETRYISIAPPDAGEWDFYCAIAGHREAGMAGVLIAT